MSEPADIHVLHVDADPNFVELTSDMLERVDGGLTVEAATGASEGLDRLARADFDCVVSDYDMPGQNGIQFLETVREDYPDLPFILYTGKGSEEVASDAISAGATDYLQKGRGTNQFELLANRIRNVVEQYRARQRAADLDRIRSLRSDINRALVRADSRAEAETRICEIISESEPYLFAWIGTVDSDTNRIEPRAWAGAEDDYLDDVTVTADDTETGHGPVGTALRERRVAVSQNVQEDPEFEPWREDALERGYQAVAAVPLAYQDTLYGELVVYADRPHAFDEDEQESVAELGSDIAHAFHSFSIQAKLRRNSRVMEEAPVGITISDPSRDDNPLIYTNEQFEEMTGYDGEETVGRNCRFLQGAGTATEPVTEMRQAIDAREPVTVELRNYRKDDTEFWNRVTIAPVENDDGEVTNFVGFQEDITERKERERELKRERDRMEGLFEAVPEPVVTVEFTDDGTILRDVNDAFEETFGYEASEAIGEDVNDLIVPDDASTQADAERIDERAKTGERLTKEVRRETRDGLRDFLFRSAPIEQTGTGGVAQQFGVYIDISERKRREETLSALHDATRDLIDAKDQQTVADRAVETARTVLNQPLNGLWLHDPDEDVLRPITMTDDAADLLGEQPVYAGDESLSWQAFEDGTLRVYDDVRSEPERLNAETPVRSEIIVPLGEHGVMNIGSTDPESFSETDISLARILGRTVETALERAEREQQLRSQRAELERQNERLEKFTSVVSHDLRNPLNVAQTRVELARRESDSEHLDDVEQAHDRMKTLIDDLLTLAREGERVDEVEAVDVADIVHGCWGTIETTDATLATETAQTIQADPSRLKQLLENLFRNAVEHAGTDVTVTVGELDDRDGFYVADDGPGIPEDEHDEVFEAGYSTVNEGTGFGLKIVQEIAEAHDWEIGVTDSEAGGARFEITGVETAAA